MEETAATPPVRVRQPLLTPEDVSEWTGLSVASLSQLRYKGTGPAYRALTEKAVRYVEADVQKWIDEKTRTITAAGAA